MNTSAFPIPTPDPLPLPGPEPILHFLLVATFFLHALFMNLVLGGTPILVLTDWVGRRTGREFYQRLSMTLSNMLPSVTALAVVLGVAPLLFVQALYGPLFYTATILIGNVWIAIVGAIIAGYYGLYAYKYWREWLAPRPGLHLAIGCLSASLFLGVALVFVTMSVLMLNPERWKDIQENGFLLALTLPSILPRYGHMVLAAIAGMGMFLVCYGLYRGSKWYQPSCADEEEYATWVIRYGVAWTLTGTLPQIVVGPWLLLALPEFVRAELINGEHAGSIAFFSAMTLALLGLVLLNAALMVPRSRSLAITGTVCLAGTVSLMVIVRDTVRQAWVAKHYATSSLPADPQWDVMVMVAILFVMAMGLIAYVVSAYWKTHGTRLPP